ncbi:MAG TPA: hypothetical protein VG820_01395 [Fimbriimonadaceae bacterium]|nr:hypothetical protein [Fimbriimonadaceae bacterium]
MHVLLLILAGLVFIGSATCWVIVLIDAFRYDTWAGVFALAFPPYWIYFAIVEFDHERKWLIAIGGIVGIWVAALLFELGMKVPVGGGAWRWL